MPKEDKAKRKQRRCCACKKTRKIVNVGGPPLCEDCFPLACNWSEAVDQHQRFMMSIAGILPLEIDIGKDDDLSYFLEEISKYLAESKMRLKQAEICLINICTMLRNEKSHKRRGKQITIADAVDKKQMTLPEKKPVPVIRIEKEEWEPIKRRDK